VNGPEVIEYAISVLTAENAKSRNVLLNNVRSGQILQLRAAVQVLPSEDALVVWERDNSYLLVLARAILDNLKPGWWRSGNQKYH
jgi:hypothetical protein